MSAPHEPSPPAPPAGAPRHSGLARALDAIERVGNALPNPATLFLIFAGLVAVASWLCAALGVAVIHPRDGSTLEAVNLLTREGVRRMFTEAVRNFMNFAPMGTVLVAMLGIGVAERSGLIGVSLRSLVMAVPRSLLTATVVFAGVMANLAADAGVILLPPLAAQLFAAAGRHPLAGFAAAFAGVAGGFSANLLPNPLDVLLVAFTREAVTASKLLPGYEVQLLGNWIFLAVSTPFLTVIGTWITDRVVEPRLGPWTGERGDHLADPTPDERRGLRAATWALVALLAVVGVFALAPWGPLRAEGATELDRLKPFFDSMVMVITLVFFVPGLAFAFAARKARTDHDVVTMTGDTLATMGTYIVLAFCASQFLAWFNWSNLGAILAIAGADMLKGMGLGGAALVPAFVALAAFINLFVTSASAKWAIMAPVFVPMFALLGFTPEATQVIFRIGDSSTNIVTPLFAYMPFLLAAAQRWDPKAGTGTLISLMLPFSVVFIVLWTLLLLAFYVFGWPIGPGVGMRLPG
uniref:AbgT family transporter n=1 Tax=Eiseniibacteriota bacterium TaxID=2212470 RepID=A0A832I4E2_UNCEI